MNAKPMQRVKTWQKRPPGHLCKVLPTALQREGAAGLQAARTTWVSAQACALRTTQTHNYHMRRSAADGALGAAGCSNQERNPCRQA